MFVSLSCPTLVFGWTPVPGIFPVESTTLKIDSDCPRRQGKDAALTFESIWEYEG